MANNGTGEDNISCVNANSGNRFKLVVIQDKHRLNNITSAKQCQAELPGRPRLKIEFAYFSVKFGVFRVYCLDKTLTFS